MSIAGGSLQASGAARTVNNAVTVSGNFTTEGANDLTLGGAMSLGTSVVRTIVTNSTGKTTFGGVVSGTNGGITKDGAGMLALTNANTYTAGTTVNGGKLLVNNTTGSGTGSGR